jgi:opacity protein-like surface antigen
MKKMILTAALALTGFIASAQFMATANIDSDFSTDSLETITETVGFGYFVNDAFVVGLSNLTADEMNVFARYYYNENLYAVATTTTEDFSDNLRIGAGYSFAAYGSFYVEPNFTFLAQENELTGERDSKFNLGLAYRF